MTNVYVRLIIYILSPILTTLAGLLAGYGVTYADGVLSIHTEALAVAVVAAMPISGGIFARWGVR
ncbi:hypothetical protein [Gemmobacter sp.]|uniref:hypothetical protein n=1 Tax=Gemmobacter sp. TaxID=1898957 RepID=UPI002AFF6BF5|nr:hypothetical protein [Gemmobacter sp.]